MDLALHAINLLSVLLDFPICAIPIRLHHLWVSYVYGAIYVIFSVIYWAAGGKGRGPDGDVDYIYPILDYGGNPGLAAGSIFGIAVALLLVHALWLGLYKVKQNAWKKQKTRQSEIDGFNAANRFSLTNEQIWTSEKGNIEMGYVNHSADVS